MTKIGNWEPTESELAAVKRAGFEAARYVLDEGPVRCERDGGVWDAVARVLAQMTLVELVESRVRLILSAWDNGPERNPPLLSYAPPAPDWWDEVRARPVGEAADGFVVYGRAAAGRTGR